MKNYYFETGQLIKELREKKCLTKSQLAEGICSPSYITRIENGERCPTSVILNQIANKLGVSNEQLFRTIESPMSLQVKELLNKLDYYIERRNYSNIYKVISIEERRLKISSILDLQIIDSLKCLSKTILNKNYKRGIFEIKNILNYTYKEGCEPTDIEWSIMGTYGLFILLDGKIEEAYSYLMEIHKYLNNINIFHNRCIIPTFYVHLVTACIDTFRYDEATSYIDYAINYCKNNNVLPPLREFYFLKGELFYRLKKEDNFKVWYKKALIFHDLIKTSDDEYFETFVEDRLSLMKDSEKILTI